VKVLVKEVKTRVRKRVVIIDDNKASANALAFTFRELGFAVFVYSSEPMTVPDAVKFISDKEPDVVVSDTYWTLDGIGEGVSLAEQLGGKYKFILTSSSPLNPQPLINGANAVNTYFIDRTKGREFIAQQALLYLETGQLDQVYLTKHDPFA
jgi:CheY-like chemotaxis protein